MSVAQQLHCPSCGRAWALDPAVWRCEACGGALDLPTGDLSAQSEPRTGAGMWRYEPWLPVATPLTLGEPTTPLVEVAWGGTRLTCKVEAALPTGSFKDRGNAVLVAALRARGVEHVVEDSSGNSAASLAAYCARAGMTCDLYVPATTSPAKLAQVEMYGGRVLPVAGPRQAAADVAQARASATVVYASHVWNPLFVAGTQTFAFELWEQLGCTAPDAIVLPVGAGTLYLGAHRGFAALRSAGLVDRVPRLYGVQSAACAPLAAASAQGLDQPVTVEPRPSAAEGVAISRPLRGAAVLEASRSSGGAITAVDDEGLWRTLHRLAHAGVLVEPTAAVAPAAVDALVATGQLRPDERVVVALTGHGLKAGAALLQHIGAADAPL